MCVMHHACYKQVKSFLFIWEGSESRKPSCRSCSCCLCSLHLNLLSIFVQRRRGRTFNPRDKSNGPRRRFVEFKCRKWLTPQPPLFCLRTSGHGGLNKSSFLLFCRPAPLIVSFAIKHINFNRDPAIFQAIGTKP